MAQDLVLTKVASGLKGPTQIASFRDGTGRMLIAEHSGTVREVDPATGISRTFLDIRERVWIRPVPCCDEQGLLGLTFPLGDGAKDHFFIAYVDRQSYEIIARFGTPGTR